MQSISLASVNGIELSGVCSMVDDATCDLVICHGLGEHVGRYTHVIEHLNSAGANIVALDLRGHGQSGGRRGHVLSFGEYVRDVGAAFRFLDDVDDQLPRYLLGHGMGGLVAVRYAQQFGEGLDGLILSGPLLGVAAEVPAIKALAGNVLSKILPGFSMATGLDPNQLSHDKQVIDAYIADPLVHDRVSARWFTEMNAALALGHQDVGGIRCPVLMMHGVDDTITDPEGSKSFAKSLTAPVETHWLDGFYHEIFNEVERDKPLALMQKWLEVQVSAKANT